MENEKAVDQKIKDIFNKHTPKDDQGIPIGFKVSAIMTDLHKLVTAERERVKELEAEIEALKQEEFARRNGHET